MRFANKNCAMFDVDFSKLLRKPQRPCISTGLFFSLAFEGINPGNKAIAVPKRGSSFRYESGSRVEFYCCKNSSGLQLTKIILILARSIPRTEPYWDWVVRKRDDFMEIYKTETFFCYRCACRTVTSDRMCNNWIHVDDKDL